MGTLTALRTEVAAAISAGGLPAHLYMPANPSPPLAVVQPAVNRPYVEPDGFGRAYIVRLDVLLINRQGSNDRIVELLDALIENTAENLHQWQFEGVSIEVLVGNAGAEFPMARVTLSNNVEI